MSRVRAVVCGATGFIGARLVDDLATGGYEVVTVGRRGPGARWDDPAAVRRLVDGADLLVNLAGRSVGCRYHRWNRAEIYRSRIETTALLHDAVSQAERPPRLWLNASTGTIYRHAMDHGQTEDHGELGEGFSVDVARDWERTFLAGELPSTRRVALRMAIVLGDGPAFSKLLTAARFGLGGAQRDGWWFPHRRYRGIGPYASGPTWWHRHDPVPHGDQRFSWIHIDDVLGAIAFVDAHDELVGPVNLAAPGTSTNAELMAALRRAAGAPFALPAPRWFLEPGMVVLQQESELVLKSRWVVPERLVAAGFTFRWPELEAAVQDVRAGFSRAAGTSPGFAAGA